MPDMETMERIMRIKAQFEEEDREEEAFIEEKMEILEG